jgi:hypothetical protein
MPIRLRIPYESDQQRASAMLTKRLRVPSLTVLVLALYGVTAGAAGPDPGINVTVTNPPSNPVPVTGSLNVSGGLTVNNPASAPVPIAGVVGAIPLLPANAFTIPPTQPSLSFAGSVTPPDPSGTRYAISSVTVTNPTGASGVLIVRAEATAVTANCRFIFNEVASADGPTIYVPAQSTVQVTFPQPYVTAAISGPQVCLAAGGFGTVGATWSAVGYKILP